MRLRAVAAAGLLLCIAAPAFSGEAAIPLDGARAVFTEARALCQADGGRLWGASLCAPIMLVDPATREVVAAQADAGGVLREKDGVYVGLLPADQNVANTAVEWSGTRWTQMLWPLPDDAGRRAILIAHELFHRLQPELSIAEAEGGGNAHLDTREGRYALQLEWRALARALEMGEAEARRRALADALAFRTERHRRFPDAQREEAALELNEGLAEYTGVMVGSATPEARRAAALHDLKVHVDDASFVRSFAYATGPAYGLLLDEFAPGWRRRLGDEAMDLGSRLRGMAGIEAVSGEGALASAAARYDEDGSLRRAESKREEERLARLRHNRQRFVEGPVLRLDLAHMSVQFNPGNLQPLDDIGTVYPTMRVTDDWGTLEVDDGALMRSDWKAVIVTAPGDAAAPQPAGEGWKLTLKPGWKLAPGERPGDYVLAHTGS